MVLDPIPPEILAEDEALRGGVALLDEHTRLVLQVTGERAAEMLHGLLTNDVKHLRPGECLYTFMLTPKGRPVAELRLLRFPRFFWLDLPETCADAAISHLRKYLPPIYATFQAAGVARLGVLGPQAAEAVDAWAERPITEGVAPLRSRELDTAYGGAVLAGREAAEGPGFDLYIEREQFDEARSALVQHVVERGGRVASRQAWEILRVERGLPVHGIDFSEADLAQEAGQDARAISFDKGCYTGQEVVARIHFRGHVNRILRGFRLPASPVGPGAVLYEAERPRATLTSVVRSPRYGTIGLGLARTEVAPGARLSLDKGGEPLAEVVDLPFGRVSGAPAGAPTDRS